MAKSSIHFESGSRHFFFHNDRTNSTKNEVFFDEKNETLNTGEMAAKIFDEELKIRSAKYSERTGQKLQKNATTHLSAIINLEKHHTLADVQKIAKKLEEALDTKVVQIAIHRDEGKLHYSQKNMTLTSGKHFFYSKEKKQYFFDENFTKPFNDFSKFEVQKNYHVHIEMLGLDSEGISLRQNVFTTNFDGKKVKKRERLDKTFYSKMQTFTAKSLGMERGQKYEGKAPKHVQTQDYKKMKALENLAQIENLNQSLAKTKDLKSEISRLRDELKNNDFEQKDYAKLDQLSRDLKLQIKSKDLTILELKSEVNLLRNKLTKTPTNAHAMGNVDILEELKEERAIQDIYKNANDLAGEFVAQIAITNAMVIQADGIGELSVKIKGEKSYDLFSPYGKSYKNNLLVNFAKEKFSKYANKIHGVSIGVFAYYTALKSLLKSGEVRDIESLVTRVENVYEHELSLEKRKIDNFENRLDQNDVELLRGEFSPER